MKLACIRLDDAVWPVRGRSFGRLVILEAWSVGSVLELCDLHDSLIVACLERLVVLVGHFQELLAAFMQNPVVSGIVVKGVGGELGHLGEPVSRLMPQSSKACISAFVGWRFMVVLARLTNRRRHLREFRTRHTGLCSKVYFVNAGLGATTALYHLIRDLGSTSFLQLLQEKARVRVRVDWMSWRLALGARHSIVLLQDLCDTLLHNVSLLSDAQAVKKLLRDAKPCIDLICKKASRLQLRLVS